MRVFLSRLERQIAKDVDLPMRCYAHLYLDAYSDPKLECSCSVFCQFPPPGNARMPVLLDMRVTRKEEEAVTSVTRWPERGFCSYKQER